MLFNKIKTLIIKKILGIFQRNFFDELKILQGQTFLEVKEIINIMNQLIRPK